MKVKVYSIEGKEAGEVELPKVFEETVRPDLIKRAFLSIRSRTYQIKGSDPLAGLRSSATYISRRKRVYRTAMNIGRARVTRIKTADGRWGNARKASHVVKGRKAHPPKAEKKTIEKINKKENRKAIRSAISATGIIEWIKKRGHLITKIKEVPVVIEEKFEEMKKAKQVKELLKKLNLYEEIEKSEKKKIKAGKGKTRGRKYKRRKSILIVVKEDKGIKKAVKNLPGVDVATVKELNAELLAPGGVPGRLTVYSKSAIEELKKM